MKTKSTFSAVMTILAVIILVIYSCGKNNKSKEDKAYSDLKPSEVNNAFLNHRDSVPSQQQYNGPLFVLSHDYPTKVKPVVNPSWQQALKGQPISELNAFAYMDSLKSHIAPNILPFFADNKKWTAAKYGWFNEPWLGLQREAILGAYIGNGNPANMFKTLKEDETGYALVLYDSTAAYTLGQIWGKTGQKVNLVKDAAQFKEGSIIVKFAFSNINYPNWPVLRNAQTFNIYDTIATKENSKSGYQIRKVSFFQMDVIVKDSKTSPKTGWVFSTFVYKINPRMDPPKDKAKRLLWDWDNMVPLGAMWGNDPTVNSPVKPPYPKLYETVINPNAPEYSKETLGWGGRLSGPNDGAVVQYAFDSITNKKYKNLAVSSCMSCHSPAQDLFNSSVFPGNSNPKSDTLNIYTPGSPKWNLWFRDNYGNVPFNSGPDQVALDYDMVTALQSIPAYNTAQKGKQNNVRQSSEQKKLAKKNIDDFKKFRLHYTKVIAKH